MQGHPSGNAEKGCWNSRHRSLRRSLKHNGNTKTVRLDDWRSFPFWKSLKTLTRRGGVVMFAAFRISKRQNQ